MKAMKMLLLELQKEKRTGVAWILPLVGILGGVYALFNFMVRKDTLLNLPLAPMDILLTQLYGMILILNLFAIVTAGCVIYHMEFQGGAVRKTEMLPVSAAKIYLCKFVILSLLLLIAMILQNAALAEIGMANLPQGTFSWETLVIFAAYSFLTAMPVLSFMLLISSRFENIWIPLGVGVAGFLSAMAVVTTELPIFLFHPFVLMLKPAAAMSCQPKTNVALLSLTETSIFFIAGLWMAKHLRYV